MGLKASFDQIKISGIVTVSGSIKKNIDDEVELFGGDAAQIERIKKTTGINTRYIADQETTSLDLCLAASRKLLDGLDVGADSIDGVVFVTQTPDYRMPGNAHLIHNALKCGRNCAVFDVELGCSGYIYGLWLAYMMASTTCRRVLLCAGDTLSKVVHPNDRSSAPIFGDAGSATLVERSPGSTGTNFILYSDGSGYHQMIQPAGGYRQPFSDQTKNEIRDKDGNIRTLENFHMNGFDVFNFTMIEQPPLIEEIITLAKQTPETVDYFILHQANTYIIKTIIRKARIDLSKVPYHTFEAFGNQVSASIPGVINNELSGKAPSNTLKCILQGFGVGLSWGACYAELDHIFCPPMLIYKKGMSAA